MSSTYVAYDFTAVTLEYISGSDWLPLRSSSVTISQSYDLSEAGVLSIGVDTLTWSVSDWVTVAHTPLPEKSVVRLRYVQPGVDTLMIAVVTGTSVEYSNGPDSTGQARWRMTTTYTAMSRPAWRLTVTKRWLAGGLPAEPVSARLGRWISSVDLMGGTDATMPPETGAGSTTLLEMVRAASDYVGRPARLVDTGSETQVTFPEQEFDLPSGWDSDDALALYSRASIAHAMGARAISQDDVDADTDVSAQLVNDDVRLLYSAWRIPDALPVPFLDPAAVTGFSMTFTPQHCSGNLVFTYAEPGVLRYRPPGRYVPGDTDTSKGHGGSTGGGHPAPDSGARYVVAFTEIDPADTDVPDLTVNGDSAPTVNFFLSGGAPHIAGYFAETPDDTAPTVASPDALQYSYVQSSAPFSAFANAIEGGTGDTLDVPASAGDVVYVYASIDDTSGVTLDSGSSSLPLTMISDGTTADTSYALYSGRALADGHYTVTATRTGGGTGGGTPGYVFRNASNSNLAEYTSYAESTPITGGYSVTFEPGDTPLGATSYVGFYAVTADSAEHLHASVSGFGPGSSNSTFTVDTASVASMYGSAFVTLRMYDDATSPQILLSDLPYSGLSDTAGSGVSISAIIVTES